MIRKSPIKAILTAGLLLAPVVCHAAQPYEVIGEIEFKKHCAACHGPGGQGDGPIAQYLKKSPPSLTTLKKQNDGEFPFNEVYEIIDGRKEVKAHGTREMPVWGDRYNVEGAAKFGTFQSEEFVRGRILEILFYLNSIQEK